MQLQLVLPSKPPPVSLSRVRVFKMQLRTCRWKYLLYGLCIGVSIYYFQPQSPTPRTPLKRAIPPDPILTCMTSLFFNRKSPLSTSEASQSFRSGK